MGGYRVEVEHCRHQRQQEGNGEDREVQHGVLPGSHFSDPQLGLGLAGPEEGAAGRGAPQDPRANGSRGAWPRPGRAGGKSNGLPRRGGD